MLTDMKCRFCKWLCDWACGPEHGRAKFWSESRRWEMHESNTWDLWIADDEAVRAELDYASSIFDAQPSRAFQIRKNRAETGSAWAMYQAGWQLEYGHGVDQDITAAEHYYRQAINAGSWLSTLSLARLIFEHDISEEWASILEEGVESDFIPANFWLALFRYKRNRRRKTVFEVRPLMEKAASHGHPGARLTLAKWKMTKKFGFGEVWQGFRELQGVMRDFRAQTSVGAN
jgi:hypothetical protein